MGHVGQGNYSALDRPQILSSVFHPRPDLTHAELDQIIPISDARALHEACPSREKTFVEIPGAGHNDIFLRDLSRYMQAIRSLVDKVQ